VTDNKEEYQRFDWLTPEMLKAICRVLGCSGMDKKCPGNPDCSILRKIRRGKGRDEQTT
jgi:hypothetical protein